MWRSAFSIAMVAAACTVDGPSNEFGAPTGMTVNPGTNASGVSETGDGASSTGSSGDSGGTDAGTGSDTGFDDSTSSTPGSTSGPPMDGSSSGGGDGATEQPAMGMYSQCTVPDDCTAPSNLCLTVNMTDGFCTNMGCVDPALDCDPSPGGTAVPVCFPVPVDRVPQDSCALDCGAGLQCPLGMQCFVLAAGSICA